MPTVDFNEGVFITHPFPSVRGADGAHDPFFEHFGKRAFECVEQAKREQVDADVIVFPIAAGGL